MDYSLDCNGAAVPAIEFPLICAGTPPEGDFPALKGDGFSRAEIAAQEEGLQPLRDASLTFHGLSYTIFPPTTVRKTTVPRISRGATAVRSRSSTTKSAAYPAASFPFHPSANSAYAGPCVYADSVCQIFSFCSG